MSSFNKNASLYFLESQFSRITSDVSFTTVTTFLNAPFTANTTVNGVAVDVSGNYDNLFNFLESFVVTNGTNGFNILLALDDGTVIYDSTKGTKVSGSTEGNTLVKYGSKSVNSDNHNTRPEILNAVLSSSGVGSARRFSSSSKAWLHYYAVRLGHAPQENMGTLRVSVKELI